MSQIWTDNRGVNSPGTPAWCPVAAVLLGLLLLLGLQLSLKWFAFLLVATLLSLVSLAVEDRKKFFLILLTLSLPVWIGMHIGFTKSPYGRSTFGFPIHFSFLPLAALYVLWGGRRAALKAPAPISTRGLRPLAALFLVAALGVLVALDPRFARFDLFALFTQILIFIYVASEIRTPPELRLVVKVLLVGAAFQAIIAIIQWLTGSTLGLNLFDTVNTLYGYAGLETLSRVGGLVGHPNTLALYFDLLLPLSFSFLFYPLSPRRRFFLLAAVGLELLALGATYSRGGISATILALFALFVYHRTRGIGLVRASVSGLFAAMLLIMVLLVVPNPIQKGLFRTGYETAYGRLPLVTVAFNLIRHHPLLGAGLNNYVHTARQYDYTPEQLTAVWNAPVHNLFLFIAGELGLPGLVCFLIFLISGLTAVYPALRSPDPFLLCTGAGIFFGILAFCVHAQVDYSIWTQNRQLWFLLGLAVVVGRFTREAGGGGNMVRQ
jgi:putative inorganic carbon (hco3(-)) transporter